MMSNWNKLFYFDELSASAMTIGLAGSIYCSSIQININIWKVFIYVEFRQRDNIVLR